MPVNSKAWLSKYIPLLRSAASHTDLHSLSESSEKSLPDVAQINEIRPTEETPLSQHFPKEESFDLSEIEHWQDLDGQVWEWEQNESDDEPEDKLEYTSLDYVEEIKNEPCWETYCSCLSNHSAPGLFF